MLLAVYSAPPLGGYEALLASGLSLGVFDVSGGFETLMEEDPPRERRDPAIGR
jgi:hypothetical protein